MATEPSGENLEAFAKAVVRLVRDATIRNCDELVEGRVRGASGARWNEALKTEEIRNAVKYLLPDVVDQTLFELLDAIDNGMLDLTTGSASGNPVSLTIEGKGELAGWFIGSGGWRDQFSAERYFDDFKDSGSEST